MYRTEQVGDDSAAIGGRSLRLVLGTGVTTGSTGRPLVTARAVHDHLAVSLEVGSRRGGYADAE